MKKSTSTADLLASIRDVVQQSRKAVACGVNTAMVLTSYEIGRLIVEHEQKGAIRAEHAEGNLRAIEYRIRQGYSVDNLQRMRQFHHMWSHCAPVSRVSGKSPVPVEVA